MNNINLVQRLKAAIASLSFSTEVCIYTPQWALNLEGRCSPYASRRTFSFSDPWSNTGVEPLAENEFLLHNGKFVFGFSPFTGKGPSKTLDEIIIKIGGGLDHHADRDNTPPPHCEFAHSAGRDDFPTSWIKDIFEGDLGSFIYPELLNEALVTVAFPKRVYHGMHWEGEKRVIEWEFTPDEHYNKVDAHNGLVRLSHGVLAALGVNDLEGGDYRIAPIYDRLAQIPNAPLKHVSDVLEEMREVDLTTGDRCVTIRHRNPVGCVDYEKEQ